MILGYRRGILLPPRRGLLQVRTSWGPDNVRRLVAEPYRPPAPEQTSIEVRANAGGAVLGLPAWLRTRPAACHDVATWIDVMIAYRKVHAPAAYPSIAPATARCFECANSWSALPLILDPFGARVRAYQRAFRWAWHRDHWPETPKPRTWTCKITGRTYRWGYEEAGQG